MKVLVILGHPRPDSYCGALSRAYINGAEEAGAEVKSLVLTNLHFEINVVIPSPQHQHREEDLTEAQNLIRWADHLVFIYPTWWGSVPAILKAFLDRVFTPGFAFRELQPDAFEKRLNNKTAQIITTMDTPVFIDKLLNGASSINALSNATLKFCGVQPVRIMRLSPIKHSTAAKKEQWLHDVYQTGLKLQHGLLTPWEKEKRKLMPWIQALRLQFYPMTFFAYGIGSLVYANLVGQVNWLIFILGYLLLFLLEAIVVFSNDYYDQESDRQNKHFSPFSGGSRVLVEGIITEHSLKKAIRILLILSGILTILVAALSVTPFLHILLLVAVLTTIAVSYTVPPLKFSYRGWGEIVVGFTHSFAVLLCGFMFQGGNLNSGLPWLLSIPLFLSIIPAIILGGFPDHDADKQVGKGTLVVRLGKTSAAYLAAISVGFSALSFVILKHSHHLNQTYPLNETYANIMYLAIIHAIGLIYLLFTYARSPTKPQRIDGMLVVALSYILWYALVPFLSLGT